MTQTEQHIQSLEIQIRVLSQSIAKAKNGRRKAADVAILAGLQRELEKLQELELNEMIAENTSYWEGVNPQEFMDMVRGREPQNDKDAEPGAMEAQDSTDGEPGDYYKGGKCDENGCFEHPKARRPPDKFTNV